MKVTTIVSVSALATAALGSTFEPADFNVTEALIANGINVAAIPELAGLVERSSLSACTIAVRYSFPRHLCVALISVLTMGHSAPLSR